MYNPNVASATRYGFQTFEDAEYMDFFLEKFLAPIVAGISVLAGQYFLQPIISRRLKSVESVVKFKYEAMEYAVHVVEKFASSLDDAVTDIAKARQLYGEVNLAYGKLMLYSESSDLLACYADFMKSMSPDDRGRFYIEVRRELGLSLENIGDPMEIPYFTHDSIMPREIFYGDGQS